MRLKRASAVRALVSTTFLGCAIFLAWRFPIKLWAAGFIESIWHLGTAGAAVYGLVYVVGVVLMVPGLVLTAGAGLVYGPIVGVLIVSPASVFGATGAFLIARYFARDWVERKLIRYPKFKSIDNAVGGQGFKLVLLLRLQPILPFALLNYALGLTRVRLRDYVLASWIGMAPATIVYVYLGSALSDVADLVSGKAFKHNAAGVALFWVGLAVGIVLLIVLTRMARNALQQQIDAPELQGAEP